MNDYPSVCRRFFLALVLCLAVRGTRADEIRFEKVRAAGVIQGSDFRFELTGTADANAGGTEVPLVSGDIALVSAETTDAWTLRYDQERQAYLLRIRGGDGPVEIKASFAARTCPIGDRPFWRTAVINLPKAPWRDIEVLGQNPDLEIRLPGTLRHKQEIRDHQVQATGILGPDNPWVVEWKGEVETVEAKLLVASEANTIVTLSPGLLRNDSLFAFTISQGQLDSLHFRIPETVSITQVQGEHLQDWRLDTKDSRRTLIVRLNREIRENYRLRIVAEMPLPTFPAEIETPVIQPEDGTRADGFLAVGTNSAIQVQVRDNTGLSQIDEPAFPHASLLDDVPRPIPAGVAFFYSFAATPYRLSIGLADVVSTFDADTQYIITVKDDDLVVDAAIDIEIRDAPVRRLRIGVPAELVVAGVTGNQVSDYTTRPLPETRGVQEITVEFQQAAIGRALLQFRLELGKSPLGTSQTIAGLALLGARNERGFVAVVPEQGVLIQPPQVVGLRDIHTRSMPVRVPDAQFAWRFREAGWSLVLPVRERPAAIRAEAFHLISVGEGIAYGSVALTYMISGAPVDELRFVVSPDLQNVEFVGLDVSRWSQENGIWSVRLKRKVLGDYNLGITYSQRYQDGGTILAGGISCDSVETQTGFIIIASHRSLRLYEETIDPALIPIGHEETPAHYRLLVSAPILQSYKYVSVPHAVNLRVDAYERGATPTVIVEFINAQTTLSINDQHDAESVTRVRYTLKNSSAQFLDITVPENIRIWSTRQMEQEGQSETATRIAAARDGNMLKIPLRRQRNPNQPLTVELEYGQRHGTLNWRGNLSLELPACEVQSTYADWTVSVPEGWVIRPTAGGTMRTSPKITDSPAGTLCEKLVRGWAYAFCGAGAALTTLVFAVLAIAAIVAPRRWLRGPVWFLLLGFLILQGLRAAHFSERSSEYVPCRTATFNQVLDLKPENPLTIGLQAVPRWRADLSPAGLGAMGFLALCGIAAGLRSPRCRRACFALTITAIALAILPFPLGQALILHLLTWGIPCILIVLLFVRIMITGSASRSAAMGILAGVVFALVSVNAGAAQGAPPPLPLDKPVPVTEAPVEPNQPATSVCGKSFSATLVAYADSMQVDIEAAFDTETGLSVPVAPATAVLLTAPESPGVGIRRDTDGLVLTVSRGRYTVAFSLLFPLPEPGDDQSRTFVMPLIPSLATAVSLHIPRGDLDVRIDDTVSLTIAEDAETTVVNAVLPPGDTLRIDWRPRGRRTQLEETVLYAALTGLLKVDSGLIEAAYHADVRVAQGEMTRLEMTVPEPMTMTRVVGDNVAGWRFDPAAHRLYIGLAQPVTGECLLRLSGQIAANTMPYTVAVGMPRIEGALRQETAVGILASSAVTASARAEAQSMNIDDYRRVAADLVAEMEETWGSDVLYAYRIADTETTVGISAAEVKPELRTEESATFSIGDERLVLNTVLNLGISKAGVFSVDLLLPDGFDVDDLAGPSISHWDETTENGQKIARVHFLGRLVGETEITLAMSRTVVQLPQNIETPRVTVRDVLKHRGQLIVSAERGVRVAIGEREGVSELDLATLQLRDKPALAVKLLRPGWRLELRTETLEPRINTEFLHVAEVTDGLVRHHCYLRFRLQNAGTKILEIQTPPEALGLVISGPEMARKDCLDPAAGKWRIELTGKWFDRAYPMEVSYETRFDREAGQVAILPVKALGADMQKGYIAIRTSARVELAGAGIPPPLQQAEARSIPGKFGAGDLADAAFCYSTPTAEYNLVLKAARHDAADLLRAEVLETDVTSVISRQGDSIHQVRLRLKAGEKRYLRATLPPGAVIWSLLVDRQSRTPSFASDSGERVLQIPIPQSTDGELSVDVDLIYIIAASTSDPIGKHTYPGPRFDLPLRNIAWHFYVPQEFRYDEFAGSLSVQDDTATWEKIAAYSISSYEAETRRVNTADLQKAVELQQQGRMLAKKGNQKAARQALAQAYNYSIADQALNEDARVNLRNLLQQQALVGLVGRRGDVRQVDDPQVAQQVKIGEAFTEEEAERVQNSLSKSDSENLEKITARMIEIQEAAAGMTLQLTIKPPLHGRQIVFRRDMQVDPNADMKVSFRITPKKHLPGYAAWLLAVLVFIVAWLVLVFPGRITAAWRKLPPAFGPPRNLQEKPELDTEEPAEMPWEPPLGPEENPDESGPDMDTPATGRTAGNSDGNPEQKTSEPAASPRQGE